jgi:6-phosphofructokinase 1
VADNQTQAVAEAIENRDFEKAMSYRDSEFQDSLQAFRISSSLSIEDHVPKDQRLRIAIIQYVLPDYDARRLIM